MKNLAIALFQGLMIVVGCLIVLLVAAVLLLQTLFAPSRDEVARVKSPSGNLVASLVEVNGGATTSFGYEINVARVHYGLVSTEVASLYGATRNASAYGVNLRWVSDKELRVEYLQAESAQTVAPVLRLLAPSIRVVLAPGVTDPAAPAGGMLSNLQERPAADG